MTKFTVNARGLQNIITRCQAAKQELLDAELSAASQMIYQRIIENLAEGQSLFAPLDPDTIRATGRTIPLGGSNGSIAMSVRIAEGENNQIVITTDHPGAKYIIHGTSRMPARNFFEIPNETLQEVAKMIAEQALHKFEQRV